MKQHHGILVEVSLRYPPVQGRLHTRYAPVRRSSAMYCYILLPLDLHVLSLPLAFILSQDQTLHCKNCSFTFSWLVFVSYTISLYDVWHTLSLISHPFQCSLVFNSLFQVENGCKNTTIFQTHQIFFQKNHRKTKTALFISCLQKEKFSLAGSWSLGKTTIRGRQSAQNRLRRQQKTQKQADNAAYHCNTGY